MCIYILYIDICLMGQGVHIFCSPMSVARVTFEARKLRKVSSNYRRNHKSVPSLEGFAKFPMCSLSEMSKVLLRRVLHKGEQNSMGLGRVFPCRPSHLSHPDHV